MQPRYRFLALFLSVFLLVGVAVRAQHAYSLGVGVKVGSPWVGLTAKGFLGNQSALEGVVTFGPYGVGATALYEYHLYFLSVPGLRWYLGCGGHFATGRNRGYNPYADGHFSNYYAGVDAVLGAEYVFAGLPISVGIDVSPMLNLVGRVAPWWNAGISVRYLIR